MEAKAILRELTYAEGLPREALKAASAQRAEMPPLFLQEIETYLALEPAARVNRRRYSSSFICSGSGGGRPLLSPAAHCRGLPPPTSVLSPAAPPQHRATPGYTS